jgi:hypothetical protein
MAAKHAAKSNADSLRTGRSATLLAGSCRHGLSAVTAGFPVCIISQQAGGCDLDGGENQPHASGINQEARGESAVGHVRKHDERQTLMAWSGTVCARSQRRAM